MIKTLLKPIKWLVFTVILLIIAFHVMVAGLLAVWKTEPITNSMFMLAYRLQGGQVTQQWVAYDDISKTVKQAAIASEDAKFVTHNGFDMEGIEKALEKNQSIGKMSAGGSTISQQLAKNLFLTSQKSYLRKADEALITMMMEKMWDKERILTAYLNVAEFGDGIYGIEAAARHYFDKPAKKLNRDEAALLICLLPNPKYYQDNLNSKRLRNKQRIIMRRMSSAQLP